MPIPPSDDNPLGLSETLRSFLRDNNIDIETSAGLITIAASMVYSTIKKGNLSPDQETRLVSDLLAFARATALVDGCLVILEQKANGLPLEVALFRTIMTSTSLSQRAIDRMQAVVKEADNAVQN